MRELIPTRLTSEQTGSFPTLENREYPWSHNNTSEKGIITNETIHQRFFDIPRIQNQVAKRQLTFIGRVTWNSDKQLLTKLLMAWWNNKLIFGGVLRSNKKTLVQNIELIVPTGSLKLWSHLDLDEKNWKYLINGIGNAPTPTPGPPPSPTNERAHPPSPPSPPRPSQAPPTLPPPRQSTRPSLIPSPQEAPTPPSSQTPRHDTYGVVKTRRDYMGILILTGRPTER